MSLRSRSALLAVVVLALAAACPVGAAAGPYPSSPAAVSAAGLSQQAVAQRFILAMKANDIQKARAYVDAEGPGGQVAVLTRVDYVQDGHSSWELVTGAWCRGLICSAAGFPATPEPAWYVVQRHGQWRVVARAFLESADYVRQEGTYGCLARATTIRNSSGAKWNAVVTVPRGTPAWWTPLAGRINVAVDAGTVRPGVRMVYGYLPSPAGVVRPACGD